MMFQVERASIPRYKGHFETTPPIQGAVLHHNPTRWLLEVEDLSALVAMVMLLHPDASIVLEQPFLDGSGPEPLMHLVDVRWDEW